MFFGEAAPRRIDGDQVAIRVDDRHLGAGCVEDGAVQFVAGAKLLLGGELGRDVPDDGHRQVPLHPGRGG
jgi:hypothetical protein